MGRAGQGSPRLWAVAGRRHDTRCRCSITTSFLRVEHLIIPTVPKIPGYCSRIRFLVAQGQGIRALGRIPVIIIVGVGGHATTASPDLGLIQFVVVVVIVVAVVVDIIEVIALIYGFLRRGSSSRGRFLDLDVLEGS